MNNSDKILNLIEEGKVRDLYKLSRKNNELKTILSAEENLGKLFTVLKLEKYYNIDEIVTFDDLHFQYSSLKDKKKIFKYIKENFTREDFSRAKRLKRTSLIGQIDNYNDFLNHQWKMVLENIDDRKTLNFVLYIVNVGGGFGLIDKEDMIPFFNQGIVYNINGNLCLTVPR